MTYKIVIPARYESTRLPGKPLLEIAGKPLLQHVYEAASKSQADEILIATDHQGVLEAAEAFGAEAVLTATTHQSGTDRIAEVAEQKQWPEDQIVVNLQGDEPLMPAALLDLVAMNLSSDQVAAIATLCETIDRPEDLADPNCVKVVFDRHQHAMYFSRAAIPYARDAGGCEHAYRHIGLYAYRVSYLKAFSGMPPGTLEKLEKLEQLRALETGAVIHVAVTDINPGPGVDTPADLERLKSILQE